MNIYSFIFPFREAKFCGINKERNNFTHTMRSYYHKMTVVTTLKMAYKPYATSIKQSKHNCDSMNQEMHTFREQFEAMTLLEKDIH